MNETIDDVRAYWDRQPCNVNHSPLPVGSKEYFDEVARRKYTVEPHIRNFADFKAWKGKSVLEIGCGIGTDAVGFVLSGANYTGVDVSEKTLELARLRFDQLGIQGRFIAGNAENLNAILPPQPFDLVYSFGVIHHTPHPEAVVESVRNYLHHGSEFRLMLYAKDSWKDIMIEAGLDQPEAQAGCPIANRFTRDEVYTLLRHYQVVSIEQTHIFPYVPGDYAKHRYTLQPWFKSMPGRMFEALEKRLGWHLLIISRLPPAANSARVNP